MKSSDFSRNINAKELFCFYVSSVLGVGILIIPAIAAEVAGPGSLVAWIILAAISAPIATSFAKMASLVPDCGGVPSFVGKHLNKDLGQMLSIVMACSMVIGNPVMGQAAASYLRNLIGFDESLVPWVGFGFMLLSVALNALGLQFSSRVQSVALLILVIGLICVMVYALPRSRLEYVSPFFPHGFASVGQAMVICFFSFLGWENVSTIAEEVRNPERAFRRAIPWALVCVGSLYCLIAWVYVSVVPLQSRLSSSTVLNPILQATFGENVALVGDVAAILLLVVATNAWVLGASRIVYALGRDGVFPRWVGKLTSRNRVPVRALVFLAIGYALATLISVYSGLSIKILIEVANANFLLIYLCAFGVACKVFLTTAAKAQALLAVLATVSIVPFLGMAMLAPVVLCASALVWIKIRGRVAAGPARHWRAADTSKQES